MMSTADNLESSLRRIAAGDGQALVDVFLLFRPRLKRMVGLRLDRRLQGRVDPSDVLGTLRYMAPEMVSGRSDARSDVYSLGLTLYEMLTLRPAFDERERGKLVRLVMNESPPRLRTVDQQIPKDLETIVHKAIDRDPAHRYQTARELADDLERYLRDEPIRARRISLPARYGRWCRRNPAAAALVFLITITVFVSSIAAVQFGVLAEHNRELAEEKGRLLAEAVDSADRERQLREDANEQRRRAEANLTLALDALNQLYVRFTSQADLPQSKDLQAALLDGVLRFYERFAAANRDLRDSLPLAESIYKRLLPVRQHRVEQNPLSSGHRHSLGNVTAGMAGVLRATDRPNEAQAMYQCSADSFSRLKQEFPEVDEFRQGLAASYEGLAATSRTLGDAACAEQAANSAKRLREQISESESAAHEFVQFRYEQFAETDPFELFGEAHVVDGRLELPSNNAPWKRGACWLREKQLVGAGFETSFELVTAGEGGIGFVIQNDRLDLGTGTLGYGLKNCIAVEFDRHAAWNPADDFEQCHVSVHSNGIHQNSEAPPYSLGVAAPDVLFHDAQPHHVRIRYIPGTITVFMDHVESPVLSVPLEIDDLLELDAGRAWIGFTGGCEGSTLRRDDLLNWEYRLLAVESAAAATALKRGALRAQRSDETKQSQSRRLSEERKLWSETVAAEDAERFDYPHFDEISELDLTGDALVVDARLRLTPDAKNVQGAVWRPVKAGVDAGFESVFVFQLSNVVHDNSGMQGDGFAFVIQNHGLTQPSGLIGYELPNSIAVEFDTFQNIEPEVCHVSLHTKGKQRNTCEHQGALATRVAPRRFDDGQPHLARILYVPGRLTLFVDSVDEPVFSVNLDVAKTLQLDGGRAWLGFTAGTGEATEAHDILYWSHISFPDRHTAGRIWDRYGPICARPSAWPARLVNEDLESSVLDFYGKFVERNKNNPNAWRELAAAHLRIARIEHNRKADAAAQEAAAKAMAACEQALRAEPVDAVRRNQLMMICEELLYHPLGQGERAVAVYRDLHRRDPRNPGLRELFIHALWRHADAQFHLGHYDESLPFLDEALELAPDDPEVLDHRANIYVRRGDDEAALRDYDRAVQVGAVYVDSTYLNRARVQLRLGHNQSAIEGVSEYLERYPSEAANARASALRLRSVAWQRLGELERALSDAQAAVELLPNDDSLHEHLVSIKKSFAWELSLGLPPNVREPKHALDLARELVGESPHDLEAQRLRLVAEFQAGHRLPAAECLELYKRTQNVEPYSGLIVTACFAQLGELDVAREFYELAAPPSNAEPEPDVKLLALRAEVEPLPGDAGVAQARLTCQRLADILSTRGDDAAADWARAQWQAVSMKSQVEDEGGKRDTPSLAPERRSSAHQLLAEAASPQGDDEKAAAHFVQALELLPEQHGLNAPRRAVYQSLCNWEDVYQRVAELRPNDADLRIERGRFFALRNRWKEALDGYAEVIDECDDFDVNWEYAGLLVLNHDQEGYRRHCERYVKKFATPQTLLVAKLASIGPDAHTWVFHDLAMINYRCGRYPQAIRHAKSSQQRPGSPGTVNAHLLAMAHGRLGNESSCGEAYRRAVHELNGESPANIVPPHWIYVNVLRKQMFDLLGAPADTAPNPNDQDN